MFFILFLVWIVLNASLDGQVLLTGIPVCGMLAFFCYRIMGYSFQKDRLFFRRLGRELAYFGYLVKEIVHAALVMIRIIYQKDIDIQPQLIYFPGKMRTRMGDCVLGNSITLTAGTITVDINEDVFCVHTLDRALAAGIENCPFAQRLRTLEE